MLTLSCHDHQNARARHLAGMFEARKRVFVDLLGWDVPVVDDRFEIDQFDGPECRYLIVGNGDRHGASARLLPSHRPHILNTIFKNLCTDAVPAGPNILEITRFCIDTRLERRLRSTARHMLISAMVDYALSNRVAAYTGVAEVSWLQKILSFGWTCRPLGAPRKHEGRLLGAMIIEIDSETPDRLSRNGNYSPTVLAPALREAA